MIQMSTILHGCKRSCLLLQVPSITRPCLVMNMNSVLCPSCNHMFELYENNLHQFDELKLLPRLENIPMSEDVKKCTHTQVPVVVSQPDSEISKTYFSLAHKLFHYLGQLHQIQP
ncbi:hypothetical protein M8J75_016441 [Diaphorina citri]|nr:hypothetical protein M8J75_016441 [Diaphorina citri]